MRTSTAHGASVGDTCVISSAVPTYWNNTAGNPTWTIVSITNATEFFLNGPTGGNATAGNNGLVRCTITTPPPGVATDFAKLQTDYKACKGSNLPAACTDTTNVLGQLLTSRRESREIILAYMAGAAPVPSGEGWKRTSDTQELLFKAKTWVLADSISTAAVSAYPVGARPSVYTDQYQKYKLGRRARRQQGHRAVEGRLRPEDARPAGRQPDDEARPQAHHDGRLRALERHAPRVPGRAHLLAEQHVREQPKLPRARCQRGSRRELRVRGRGAVGLRARTTSCSVSASGPRPRPPAPRRPRATSTST